jgi:filamentous hemagglutinin family protein
MIVTKTHVSSFALRHGAVALAVAIFCAGAAGAQPQGGAVVGGKATIAHGPAVVITSSTAIVNWAGFSIPPGTGTVVFSQPPPSQTALNRVKGVPAPVLLGALTANGQIWAINPAGKAAPIGTPAPSTLTAANNIPVVVTTAKSVLDRLINTSRIVEAQTAATVNGRIVLSEAPGP